LNNFFIKLIQAKRIEKLSAYIADIIGANTKYSARAGLLSKTDLITDMVGNAGNNLPLASSM
jgi:glycyl-tRNA synthetase beta subunit